MRKNCGAFGAIYAEAFELAGGSEEDHAVAIVNCKWAFDRETFVPNRGYLPCRLARRLRRKRRGRLRRAIVEEIRREATVEALRRRRFKC